jgi:cytochrome c peroxidase
MKARLVFWMLATSGVCGCATSPPAATTDSLVISGLRDSPPTNPSQVALGRFLFHDSRLSRDQKVSCGGCHTLSKFGLDGKPAGFAVGGLGQTPNAPSAFNIQSHIVLFWQGEVRNEEAQGEQPVARPTEMIAPIEYELAEVLGRVPRYVQLFREGFPNDTRPILLKNVAEAIEAFERGLVNNSRWDRFVAGDISALTLEEKQGLRVFLKTGCGACHAGQQVGGTMYQTLGLAYPWPKKAQAAGTGTSPVAYRPILRVPSLKNIAETAPYFHDNATSNLQAAIHLMGYHQLGVELSNEEVDAIAAWMRSLTGEVEPEYIAVPELPPAG